LKSGKPVKPVNDDSLDAFMSGRCGRCEDWHATGAARAVIKAFEEHRERCPGR
jgi:hypothetical protein